MTALFFATPGDALQESFDLVITDLNMPGLTGFDVAEYVKGKNRTQ